MRKNHRPKGKSVPATKASTSVDEQSISRSEIIDSVLHLIDDRIMYQVDQSGRPIVTWINDDSFDTMEFTSKRLYFRLKNLARTELKLRLNKVILAEVIEEMLAQAHEKDIEQVHVHHRVALSMVTELDVKIDEFGHAH